MGGGLAGEGAGGGGLELVNFFSKHPNLKKKKFFFCLGGGGAGRRSGGGGVGG